MLFRQMRRLAAWFGFLLLLLPPFLSAGKKADLCEQDWPTGSPFSPLPSDTVNRLPHAHFSARLESLLQQAVGSSKKPIRFTQLPPVATDFGITAATTRERIIAMRPGLRGQLEENAIAHEVLHIILQDEGYAGMVQVPITRTERDDMLGNLGTAITSCVDDGVIDRKMVQLGFKPRLLNHASALEFQQQPPAAPADRIAMDGNALSLYCFSHRLLAPGDDPEKTWTKISPEVVRRSHELAKRIGNLECDSASTCLLRKQRIRDALGYPIRFCNPKSGRYE